MFTPQQIEEISFATATFGGYDKRSVDEFLGPLTEDYVVLYKENALLKSKMRVLVTKLEEYRTNEASMKQAIIDAQTTCDTMVKQTEAKCAQMLSETNSAAAENARLNNQLVQAENEKVEAARREANNRIAAIESQLKACLEALAAIKLASCRYAKRQLTWLRRGGELRWLYREDCPDEASALAEISRALRQ